MFGRVRAYLSMFARAKITFFRVWRATGGCSIGWAGRAVFCSAWFPRRARDAQNDMTLTLSRPTVAAGPRLRSFMFRTIVLQDREVCSCWKCQGASQNGGGFPACSGRSKDSQQLSELQLTWWKQLTAPDQAASSLTRVRRTAVRIRPQATCIRHLLEQFFNRQGNRNCLRARCP